MRRLLQHPLAGYLLVLLLIAAILQGAGRLAMSLASQFEGAVNAYLGDRITVVGLKGGWDGLNPVVRMSRVEMPSGWVEQVLIEFDWLETLMRNSLTMQRLFIDRGSLNITYTDQGWALAGAGAAWPDFDWGGLMNDTDEVRFKVHLVVEGAPDSLLATDVRGINRDGLRGFDVSIVRPDCASDCAATVHWRFRSGRWWFQPTDRYARVDANLTLPAAYFPGLNLASGIHIEANGQWAQRGGQGGGEINSTLAAQFKQAAAPPARLGLGMLVASADGAHAAVISKAQLSNGQRRLGLGPLYAKGDWRQAEFWIDELPLHELSAFLIDALDENGAVPKWLAGASPRGVLRNVRVGASADGLAYAATLDSVQTSPYRGLPLLQGADGALIGHDSGLALALNSKALKVHFADTFTDSWSLDNVRAHIELWFADGYLGLRAPYFKGDLPDGSLAGTLALARPPRNLDQHLSLLLRLERLAVPNVTAYVPYNTPPALQQWLLQAPRQGLLSGLRLAYQGQVHTQTGDYARRTALTTRLSAGEVRFHSQWPLITDANANIRVSGEDVFAQLDRAKSMGVGFQGSYVHVGGNGEFAQINLRAGADAGDAIAYVRGSPILQWLSFIEPDWSGAGRLRLEGELFVPLNTQDAPKPFDASLAINLNGVGLNMPNYRLALAGLNGDATYRFPYELNSKPITGTLFGRSATLTASAGDGSVDFHIVGEATPDDVYHLAELQDFGLASGAFSFDAALSLPVNGRVPHLTTRTALEGLELHLPGEFGKAPEAALDTLVELQFLDEYTLMQIDHGVVQGWVKVDEGPLRGALGVRSQPSLAEQEAAVVITGRTESVDVHEWTQRGEGLEFPMPWRLDEVDVGQVLIETTSFDNVRVSGDYLDGLMTLAFDSEDLKGRLRSPPTGPLELHFDAIRLPEEPGDEDPLDAGIIERLPEADVSIDSVVIGDEDFGRWSFAMRPQEDGVLFDNLNAHLKGTTVSAADGLFWSQVEDRSTAKARLTMADLYEVLPQWGYAPNLRSEAAELLVHGSWPGSPLNVAIENLSAEATFNATNGEFVEVESGAGARRLFSLLNFTTIARRMNLNFQDVAGKGVSFDTIKAEARFDEGTLRFLKPAKMKGSGSDFKIGGSIDLVAGLMNNNEMIVTLPVSDSLPWYAVYVSLANPAAGLAVLAGQQVLKKQIKQFSSAKYEISGSWDDPEVKLVGIWNDKLQAFDELANEQPPDTQEDGA